MVIIVTVIIVTVLIVTNNSDCNNSDGNNSDGNNSDGNNSDSNNSDSNTNYSNNSDEMFEGQRFAILAMLKNYILLYVHKVFNRPCVAGAALQSPPSLTDLLIH